MNIYITPANEQQLREYAKDPNQKGNTMSGLVNELLAAHFEQGGGPIHKTTLKAINEIKDRDKSYAHEPTAPFVPPPTGGQLKEDVPIPVEKPCCMKSARCQHWDWDSDNSVWVNTLSGRKVENEV